MKKFSVYAAVAAVFLWGSSYSMADELRFEIENAAPAGGFFLTPVFLGFHDGGFDLFDVGGTTSAEFERLVEDGVTSNVADLLAAQQASSFSATVLGNSTGPPPFDPGEVISQVFNLNTNDQRFLSFASMVIPSNDAFIGNDNAIELFDAMGSFIGPSTIEITAGMIFDGGTEVNNINGGAAFSANGGTPTTESNAIAAIALSDLNDFIGSDTASGATITSGFDANTVVARINIRAVPEPGSLLVLSMMGIGLFTVRRRKS